MEVNRLLKSRFLLSWRQRWDEQKIKEKKNQQRRVEVWERSFLTVIAVAGGADAAAATFYRWKSYSDRVVPRNKVNVMIVINVENM